MKPKLEVGDIVEYGLDSFGKKPQTWRVTHHLKRMEDTLDTWEPEEDEGGKILKEVLLESREEERTEQKKRGLKCEKRYYLNYCKSEEATHVSLVSICGACAPIKECKKVGIVNWSQEKIEEEKRNAVSDFWLANNFPKYWYWE